MKEVNRATSLSTEIAARLVRALSAPASMISAPLVAICWAWASATSESNVPSPQKESSFRLTMPMTRGRRGNVRRRPRACRIIFSVADAEREFAGKYGPIKTFRTSCGDLPPVSTPEEMPAHAGEIVGEALAVASADFAGYPAIVVDAGQGLAGFYPVYGTIANVAEALFFTLRSVFG